MEGFFIVNKNEKDDAEMDLICHLVFTQVVLNGHRGMLGRCHKT